MAKVKITGHASGSGVITVTAPNTSTDRTITLPDSTDTLAVNSDVTNKLPLAGGTMTGNLVVSGTNAAINITAGGTSEDSVLNFVQGSTTEGGITFDHNGSYASENIKFRVGNNTEHLKIMGDGRGLSQFTAKAWVNFNGTGTIAIRDSHNISSVTDITTGQYQPNFANALGNANYAVSSTVGDNLQHTSLNSGVFATTSFRIHNFNDAGAYTDTTHMMNIIFGD